MLAILELNPKGLHQSSGRNVQKSVMHVQSCLSKPISFLPFSLPSPSSLRKLRNNDDGDINENEALGSLENKSWSCSPNSPRAL